MIKISGFEGHIITELRIVKEANRHSKCTFGFAFPGDIDELLGKVRMNINVHDENGAMLFSGFVEEILADKIGYCGFRITVKAVSASQKLDIAYGYRIFQDTEKTLGDIVHCVGQTAGLSIECSEKIPISEPVLQCGETDFQFLIRTASKYGLSVFDCDCDGKIVVAKNLEGQNHFEHLDNFKDRLWGIRKAAISAYGRGIRNILELTYYERAADIGYKVKLNNAYFYISVAEFYLEDAVVHYKYTLREIGDVSKSISGSFNENAVLRASVVSVDPNGNIQVDFCDEKFEAADSGKRLSIPFETPFASKRGVMSFLPEKGDSVEVVFANGKYSARYVPGEQGSHSTDTSKKFISVDGMRVTFGNKSLDIEADGSVISVSKSGIVIKSNNSEISLDKNIRAKSVGNVDIKGNKIHLK